MGAAAVWLWGREIEAYAEEKTREARSQVADGVRAVEEKAGNLLRRVDEFVRDRKEDVSEALEAAEETIRPAPAV